MQNDWFLFNQKLVLNTNDTLTIASIVFETYLGKSYVLPDSGVFLFQEIGNNDWEIWSGFRASKLDAIRVFKTGLVSKYHIEINDSIRLRTNFRGAKLKATTVVRKTQRIYSHFICNFLCINIKYTYTINIYLVFVIFVDFQSI